LQQWQAERLVEKFRRECRRVSAGIMDARDLPGRLWYFFPDEKRVCPEVVPRLWAFVPESARAGFAEALRLASLPEFRLLPWLREYQPMTWEELEADAEARSARVRAWAVEFCRFLDAAADAVKKTTTPSDRQIS
jgi:hypothetical protein